MDGVVDIFKDVQIGKDKKLGIATLTKYRLTEEKALLDNRMYAQNNTPYFFWARAGEYIVLQMDGYGVMMSDTWMERKSNVDFIMKANGKVMIAGLGIGLILHNLRSKIRSGEVTEIVIYEKYQEVIDLISPYYADLPITYKCADILEYQPPKDEIYDTIYFDIWESIGTQNLPEMAKLHRRWGRRRNKKNPQNFMSSWLHAYLLKLKRNENR